MTYGESESFITTCGREYFILTSLLRHLRKRQNHHEAEEFAANLAKRVKPDDRKEYVRVKKELEHHLKGLR